MIFLSFFFYYLVCYSVTFHISVKCPPDLYHVYFTTVLHLSNIPVIFLSYSVLLPCLLFTYFPYLRNALQIFSYLPSSLTLSFPFPSFTLLFTHFSYLRNAFQIFPLSPFLTDVLPRFIPSLVSSSPFFLPINPAGWCSPCPAPHHYTILISPWTLPPMIVTRVLAAHWSPGLSLPLSLRARVPGR